MEETLTGKKLAIAITSSLLVFITVGLAVYGVQRWCTYGFANLLVQMNKPALADIVYASPIVHWFFFPIIFALGNCLVVFIAIKHWHNLFGKFSLLFSIITFIYLLNMVIA